MKKILVLVLLVLWGSMIYGKDERNMRTRGDTTTFQPTPYDITFNVKKVIISVDGKLELVFDDETFSFDDVQNFSFTIIASSKTYVYKKWNKKTDQYIQELKDKIKMLNTQLDKFMKIK